MTTLSPKQLNDFLVRYYKENTTKPRSICIEGPPGGGKTTVVQQVAAHLEIPCVTLHLPTMLVEHFGFPLPDTKTRRVVYSVPEWWPDKRKEDTPEFGILLFDDRNQCSPSLQMILANIIQSRTLHDVPLPEGWLIVSTGNRVADKTGSMRVLPHLRNRETVIGMHTDVDAWTAWAVDNRIRSEIIAFVNFRPNLLHDYNPDADQNPTPRAWAEGVSPILGLFDPYVEHAVIKGAIGEGAAAEFKVFQEVFSTLPDIDELLKDPKHYPLPGIDKPNVCYALVVCFIERVKKYPQEVSEAVVRLPLEFVALFYKMLTADSEKYLLFSHKASADAINTMLKSVNLN